MPSTTANGIRIEYETAGDSGRPPLILIMGLGAQLIAFDDDLVAALVDRGFYVVRFDNRDVGRSTWLDEAGVPDMMAAFRGQVELPYRLSDMADDTAGLLDALGIESAHVLGVSMGGMIAQSLAIQDPQRVRTLISIMSTTGDPLVGQPHPEAMAALLVPPPQNQQEVVEQALKNWRVFGSPGFPQPDDRIAARAIAAYQRGFHPAGTARQMVAVGFASDRTPQLGNLDIPALVIHGESDPLIDPSGGRATAAAVPGAILWTIPGMGHDLPSALYGEVADRVAAVSGL